jgi:hypothetical protein
MSSKIAPYATEACDVEVVRTELSRILKSRHFRASRQCQELLSYIVEYSLKSQNDALKERVIGVKVFGRSPAYDTAEDPVVRVRAADVRKRLAQYYQSREQETALIHIELHPGSYRANFSSEMLEATPAGFEPAAEDAALPETEGTEPASRRLRLAYVLTIILLASLGIAATTYLLVRPSESAQRQFWSPFTSTGQPALVYLGSNAAYRFTPSYLAKYRADRGISNNGPEFYVRLTPKSSISVSDLIPTPDTFVTLGDLAAVVQITTLMSNWRVRFALRSGKDVAFGDLRNRPVILVGGFNNPWTLQVTNDLPFSLHDGTSIEERGQPAKSWSITADSTTDDYALISRLLQSKTGGPALTVAGIGEAGTQAAAEYLANAQDMNALLRNAPHGWQNKNVQIVLHVKKVDYLPVKVEVVATRYW